MTKEAILTPDSFDNFMERVRQETGARTQIELAEILAIRQSSISDAKRRGSVPGEWQLKLMILHSLNPVWLLTGDGPRYVAPSDDKETAAPLMDVPMTRKRVLEVALAKVANGTHALVLVEAAALGGALPHGIDLTADGQDVAALPRQ